MSDYIDTRDGWAPQSWRPVEAVNPTEMQHGHVLWEFKNGESVRAWVREEPVASLPTQPYTVIRVSWRDQGLEGRTLTLGDDRRWNLLTPDEVMEQITGFKVLAEPRDATAVAVINRLLRSGIDWHDLAHAPEVFEQVAREFGGES